MDARQWAKVEAIGLASLSSWLASVWAEQPMSSAWVITYMLACARALVQPFLVLPCELSYVT